MKFLQGSALLISSIFISSNAFAACTATAGFDKAMEEYNLAELSQSLQSDILDLSKDYKNILHTGKPMNSIESCNKAISLADGNS